MGAMPRWGGWGVRTTGGGGGLATHSPAKSWIIKREERWDQAKTDLDANTTVCGGTDHPPLLHGRVSTRVSRVRFPRTKTRKSYMRAVESRNDERELPCFGFVG